MDVPTTHYHGDSCPGGHFADGDRDGTGERVYYQVQRMGNFAWFPYPSGSVTDYRSLEEAVARVNELRARHARFSSVRIRILKITERKELVTVFGEEY